MNATKLKTALVAMLVALVGAQYVVAACFKLGSVDCTDNCNCSGLTAPTYSFGALPHYVTAPPGQEGYIHTKQDFRQCRCTGEHLFNNSVVTFECYMDPVLVGVPDESSNTCTGM